MEDNTEKKNLNFNYYNKQLKKMKNNDNLNQGQNLQKFNVEKYNEKNSFNFIKKKINNNNNKLCEKCKTIINSFSLNKKFIKLLFNQSKYSSLLHNNNSFINNLLINPNLCPNCLKNTIDTFYFKESNINNFENIEKEIINIFQVLENMKEEKLNINANIYHIYKRLINSFIEYIKDNHDGSKYDEINNFNIKNQEIIGVDCMLNIIDLFNKNILLIKEKNVIIDNFCKEIIKEKNLLINEINNNNKGNNNFSLKSNNEKINEIVNDKIKKKNNIFLQPKINFKNNQNLFKTELIKTKIKRKKFKRINRKIKFIIKTK